MGITHLIITQDVHLLKLNAPLVGWFAAELERIFKDLKNRNVRRVILDLADVSFMDSRGLAALIKGLRIFGRYDDCLQLVSPQTQPALLLDLTGFDRIVSVITVEELQRQIKRPHLSERQLRPVQDSVAAPA